MTVRCWSARAARAKRRSPTLVARFHDPNRGAILLNGIDLRQIKLRSYRQLLAVVQQETFLFDGTVSENIAYGLRDAGDEQIRDAARLCQCP